MKIYYTLILAAIVLFSCNSEDRVTIKGSYPEGKGEMLSLEMLNINQLFPIDSFRVKNNGTYRFSFDLENPELILLKNKKGQIINLLPYPGDVIGIDIADSRFSTSYTIQGSPESEKIRSLVKKVERTKNRLDSISNLAAQKEEIDDSDPLIEEYAAVFKQQRKENIRFVIENLSSLSSIYALYQRVGPEQYIFNDIKDLQYLKIVSDSLKVKYPNSSLVASLIQDVDKRQQEYERLLLLSNANNAGLSEAGYIDLNIPDREGNEISISSLKGKVILLNFWASYDQRSRESNLVLKSVYDKYHTKGFEVYSVSLDNNKAAWLDACRFEDYGWIEVCELSYPQSYAASVYNIQEIPTTFLIDREGNLIARNLYGKTLGTWLDNLL